jgi:hypothetical protein
VKDNYLLEARIQTEIATSKPPNSDVNRRKSNGRFTPIVLKNSFFRGDHNLGDRLQPRRKIP